jgi:GT2 family glycosyltransferase
LASVTRHAPPRTEILVVDDASAGQAAGSVAADFSGVRCLRLSRRRGFCAAVNAGIRAAQSDIVELLNDDTEVTADWADGPLARFEDSSVAAVAPLVFCWRPSPALRAGERMVDSAGDRYYLGGVAGKRGHRQPLGPSYLRPARVFGASASSGFFRREALFRVGGFPESFGAYFEDVDLSFRLHRAGYQILFEPTSQVLHHVSASYGTARRQLLEQQSWNEERVFWRNLPPRALVRAMPHHLAVLAAKTWQRCRDGGLLPFLSGRLRMLGELPALLRHRRWLRQLGDAADTNDWHVEERFWGERATRA